MISASRPGVQNGCSRIVRTSAGALSGPTVAGGGYIAQWGINTGTALVSGIDVQANYRLPLPGRWGALVTPTWRHNLRVTWEMPWQLRLSAQWRFIGSTRIPRFFHPWTSTPPEVSTRCRLTTLWAASRMSRCAQHSESRGGAPASACGPRA